MRRTSNVKYRKSVLSEGATSKKTIFESVMFTKKGNLEDKDNFSYVSNPLISR